MDGSHLAPCRIAPRPVRKKYWPESRELRHGVHEGAVTKACLNKTPLSAIRSNTGVLTTEFGLDRFSTLAYALAYLPQSSANANIILGPLLLEIPFNGTNNNAQKKNTILFMSKIKQKLNSLTYKEAKANCPKNKFELKNSFRNIAIGLTFACLIFGSIDSLASDWNQWRGNLTDGSFKGSAWPNSLKESNLKKSWSTDKLGPSYSGPITDGQYVFTTESTKGKESVIAYNLKDGELKWKQTWAGEMKVPFFAARNGSWIRSTPAVANGKVFVGGMRDHFLCLNAKNGKLIWEINFPKKYGTPLPDFGFASSPLVDEKYVYVQAGATFNKIDQETGTVVWQALNDKGGMYGSAFASPTLAKINNNDLILVQTRSHLNGINPLDGKVLWNRPIKAFRGMNILTPLAFGDGIFTSTYGGGSSFISVTKSKDEWGTDLKWKNNSQGYMCSPVQYNGKAYLHLRSNRFACYDLKTGKEQWVSSKSFGKYMSLVINGNKILALDQKGILYLIKADPEKLNILSEREVVDGESWAHLGIQGQKVIVRSLNRLYVFDWKNQ